MNLHINGRRKTPKAFENVRQRLYDCVDQPAGFVMTDARTSTTLQDQTSATSPVSAHTLSSEAVLDARSEEHTSELQSQSNLVCRLLLEKKKKSYDKHLQVTSV